MLVIQNGRIIAGTRLLDGHTLLAEDGVVKEIACSYSPAPGDEVINAEGRYVSPGFIDLHQHGGGGHDYMDGTAEAFWGAAMTHLAHGTCAITPTTSACLDEELIECISCFEEVRQMQGGPRLLGMHLEGPYFSMEMRGAQDPRFLTPPAAEHYLHILELARGNVLRWSYAPELEGADAFCRYLTEHGIYPVIGHSDGYYEDVLTAYDSGCRAACHLYSGMSTIRRHQGMRRLGVIEAALLLDDMMVELICDGVHLPPELIRLVLKTKGAEHIVLVTDAMRAAGQDTDKSVLGSLKNGQHVLVEDGVAKLADRSAFAGSVATADRLVRVMHKQVGVDIVSAVRMLSYNPAKSVGLHTKMGTLAPGCHADIILFDEDINVSSVIVGGKILS